MSTRFIVFKQQNSVYDELWINWIEHDGQKTASSYWNLIFKTGDGNVNQIPWISSNVSFFQTHTYMLIVL